jgi:DNA-binding NarL/FixJ family response regulator
MANQPKLVRQLLLDMLEEESCIEIVGEATQESEIRELVEKTAADLVMVTADKLDRRSAIWLEPLNEFLALYRGHAARKLCRLLLGVARYSCRRNRIIETWISWRSEKSTNGEQWEQG